MTEPRANVVRWLLINGGIRLTSSCYSQDVFPLVLSASTAGYTALTSYVHSRDRLPAYISDRNDL